MPETPQTLLGSTLPAALLAVAAGVAVGTVVWYAATRRRLSPRAFAAVVGASYAALTVCLWVGVRVAAHPTPFSADPSATAFWLALAALGAAAFGGGTAFATARVRYVTAPLALFAVTVFTWALFLQTAGGSVALSVWGLVYVPVFLVAAAALFGVEWLVRRFLGRQQNGGAVA